MSVTGIASSILSALSSSQNNQTNQSNFQNLKSEFQQLGQDLQSGNLTQAETDYTTLSQQLPASFTNAIAANTANPAASTAATTQSPLAQAFSQLGQDLQSGNLQGAQQLYANIQQDFQQGSQQVGGHHHHHHHSDSSQNSSTATASSSNNPIVQAFSTLAQDLQTGNLSGAQSAFATLQSDLQQIGGFVTAGSNGASTTAASATGGSLNVTV